MPRRRVATALACLLGALPFALPDRVAPAVGREPGAYAARVRDATPLVFGIYPGGAAGTVGPSGRTLPEDPGRRLERLERLRGGRPFVLHLYDSFTRPADGERLPAWLAGEIDDYTSRGFGIELVLTYRPADPAGDPDGFAGFVRRRVRQLGPNAGVVSLQVTNEANVDGAPNAADGAYGRVHEALVRGVVAASDEAARGGFGHLRIGFNWAYQHGPAEQRFWRTLHRYGGGEFARAVDWVGVDAYPGTWGPPLRTRRLKAGARAAMLDALRLLRREYLPLAGLGNVALHVSEAGYPTGPRRSERRQVAVMRAVIRAVSDNRAALGVTDFRWFDLRDADSSSPSFESRYGLVRDDYRPKRGFEAYRKIIRTLG